MSGGTFWDGFKIGAISAAAAFASQRTIGYLKRRGLAEREARRIYSERGIDEVKRYPGQDPIAKNVDVLRKQLEVVRDKYNLPTFWSKSNQIRIGRYDTKFYAPKAYIHFDTIDVNVNPVGHFVCDKLQLCR